MTIADADLDSMIEAFSAVDVVVRLQGVQVKTIRGRWKRRTELVGQNDQLLILPSVTCKTSDLKDVTRAHTFEIEEREYRAYGDYIPRNSGLSTIGLVAK